MSEIKNYYYYMPCSKMYLVNWYFKVTCWYVIRDCDRKRTVKYTCPPPFPLCDD